MASYSYDFHFCSFFDTNVLIYLASTNQAKADQAETIVSTGHDQCASPERAHQCRPPQDAPFMA
jgi:hypothetical protein